MQSDEEDASSNEEDDIQETDELPGEQVWAAGTNDLIEAQEYCPVVTSKPPGSSRGCFPRQVAGVYKKKELVAGIVRGSHTMYYMPHLQSINGLTKFTRRSRVLTTHKVITHLDTRNAKVRFWHDDCDSTYENKLRIVTYNDGSLHAALDSLTGFSGSLAVTSAMSTIAHIN